MRPTRSSSPTPAWTTPPIHLLAGRRQGGNGVYAYGAGSSFPEFHLPVHELLGRRRLHHHRACGHDAADGDARRRPPTVPPASRLGSTVTAIFSEADRSRHGRHPNTFGSCRPRECVGGGLGVLQRGNAHRDLHAQQPLWRHRRPTRLTIKGGADRAIKDVAGNALAGDTDLDFTTGVVGGACAAPANAIVAENCLTGNPASEWDISGAGDPSIQGFATDISVNRGRRCRSRSTPTPRTTASTSTAWATTAAWARARSRRCTPSATLPQTQPACLNDAATGLIDCGNWACRRRGRCRPTPPPASTSPKLVRTDTGGASHIVFIVRDDASTSDLLFQTSDTTWQAYNNYGGNSLYTGRAGGAGLQGQLQPARSTRAAWTAAGLGVQRRVPDGALAGGERLRRQLLQRRRHRPPRQPAC